MKTQKPPRTTGGFITYYIEQGVNKFTLTVAATYPAAARLLKSTLTSLLTPGSCIVTP